MKDRVREAQVALPEPHEDRSIEASTIVHPQPPQPQSLAAHEDQAASRWIYCLARGRHVFDEKGICVDCDAERKTS